MNLFRNAPDATSVTAGTIICQRGDPGGSMFAIVEGTVEIFLGDKILQTLGAGDFFGEMSLVDRGPRSASARARTDCRIVTVDEKRFGFMVQQTPYFALEIIRVLVGRLRQRMGELG